MVSPCAGAPQAHAEELVHPLGHGGLRQQRHGVITVVRRSAEGGEVLCCLCAGTALLGVR